MGKTLWDIEKQKYPEISKGMIIDYRFDENSSNRTNKIVIKKLDETINIDDLKDKLSQTSNFNDSISIFLFDCFEKKIYKRLANQLKYGWIDLTSKNNDNESLLYYFEQIESKYKLNIVTDDIKSFILDLNKNNYQDLLDEFKSNDIDILEYNEINDNNLNIILDENNLDWSDEDDGFDYYEPTLKSLKQLKLKLNSFLKDYNWDIEIFEKYGISVNIKLKV